jgi:DNA modification methylase
MAGQNRLGQADGVQSKMNQVFVEMKRMLKKDGKTCIVTGNTSFKGVEILNAEVFVEQLQNLGLKIADIIKRVFIKDIFKLKINYATI